MGGCDRHRSTAQALTWALDNAMDITFFGDKVAIGLPDGSATVLETFASPDGETVRVYVTPSGKVCALHAQTPLFHTLREFYGVASHRDYALVARAAQIVHWRRSYQFCPQCASPLIRKPGLEMAMRCECCHRDFFPRIDPAVIVAIEFQDKLLLAERAGEGGKRFHSLIAGFVETGENLEEAVRREVREEVGLELASLDYVRSQPWPFPSQLMIGFRATAVNGDINVDGNEVSVAGWYSRNALPASLPRPMSIARQLIDEWLNTKPCTQFASR